MYIGDMFNSCVFHMKNYDGEKDRNALKICVAW